MEFYKILLTICTVVGAATLLILIIGFIKEVFEILLRNYVSYRIHRTNKYISKYRNIIDRFIESTSELSLDSINKEKCKNIDLEICKLIDEYKGIK